MNAEMRQMQENLYMRVKILEDNQVISGKVADYTRHAVDMLLEEKPDVSQEKAEMFFTHLAMAGMRAEQGIEENPMDAAILESTALDPVYEKAVDFRDRMLQETDIEFPQTEKDFLSVHLCNLFNE